MNPFNKYLIKYAIIYFSLIITKVLLRNLAPNLYMNSNPSGSITYTSFLGLYEHLFFNAIIALFIYFDLRPFSKTAFYIPVLTILSMEAGLLLFSFAIFNNVLNTEYDKD